jgi:hypothetical protein
MWERGVGGGVWSEACPFCDESAISLHLEYSGNLHAFQEYDKFPLAGKDEFIYWNFRFLYKYIFVGSYILADAIEK